MDERIKQKIDERIDGLIDDLSAYSIDSKEKKAIVEELETLHKLRIEELKMHMAEREIDLKTSEMERDQVLKSVQASNQRLDNIANSAVKLTEVLLNIIAYDIWNRRGLRFEMTGTVGSLWTRNLMSKMLPKK